MSLCPSQDELERLLSESLSETARTRVLDHVEDCAECQKTLARLVESVPGPTGDCLRSALGGASDVKSASEPAFFRQLKQRVRLPESQTPEVEGFDIFEEIGRGAAAVVYRARHRDLGRFVALKVIPAGPQVQPQVRERFRREAEAIARFQHPNIVQVYSIGEQGDSLYLALELVESGNLTAWLGVPRPAREAARLVATLAAAIDYAHRQGVIHRDLKPANILLQINDSDANPEESRAIPNAVSAISNLQSATPKITDFGLAKLLPLSGSAADRMTHSGAILGTPAYTAPEQAQGKAADVGPTADIYSLGAILYELLTGRPPFQGTTAVETLVQVAHQEPVPPARLVPQVPRDLQTICLKCLEKDPHKRYATSGDLAADLERFLKHEPVLARPVGRVEGSLRWARRNKGVAAALIGVALLLVLLVTGSLVAAAYFQRQEEREHILYLEKRDLADDKGRLLNENEAERQKAVRAEMRESGLRQLAEKQGETLRRNLYLAQMNLAGQAAASPSGMGRLAELLALGQQEQAALRNWEWYYLYGLCHRDVLTLRGHQYEVRAVAWSPDCRQLASAGTDGLILVWDAAEGREMRALHGDGGSEARSLAWSPDGRRLASAGTNGTVKVWDPANCKEVLAYRGHAGGVCAVAWSPDGNRIVSGGGDRTIHVWDFANGKNASVLRGHTGAVFGIAWSPDGKRIASAGEDSTVRLWDSSTGTQAAILRGHLNWVNSVAWSPSGARLASVSNDRSLKVWDATLGKEVLTLQGHAQSVTAVAWSPDGARLVTGSDDNTVKIWAATGGPAILTLRGHTHKCSAVAWSADGKRLASAASDATIKIWAAATGPETPVLQSHGSPIEWLAWRADSECFACASCSDTITVWDRRRHQQSFLLHGHRGWVRSVCWSPDGKRLASGGDDQTIRIWDSARHNEVTALHGHTDVVTSVSWSADGTRLASASHDKTVRTWDALSGKPLQICRGHDQVVHCITWSPDNKRLATASWDGTVRVWDAKSGREVFCLRGHRGSISGVSWSRQGDRLASAGHDGTIKIWDTATGDLTLTLRGHNAQVTSVDWNPDGTRLASSSWDRTVKIWDMETGKETLTLAGHEHGVNALAWSPDGLALVSGGDDETILVHDAATGYVAGLAPQYLSLLNRRLGASPTNAAEWRLRGEIDAGLENWNQAAADFKQFLALDPRQHWVSLGCWVAGPYSEDLAKSCPPERVSFPSGLPTGTAENDVPPKWERVPMNACGFVNFGALFAQAEHISAYAVHRVYSPRRQDVAILLGSDDQVRLWLNGKQIHEFLDQATAMPDARAVPATLESGWNTLLARVTNATGDHALYLRLSDSMTDRRRAYEGTK